MKVRATKTGYFDLKRRYVDDEFVIPDEPKGKDGKPALFSKNWMEPVDPPDAKSEGGQKDPKEGKKK